MYIYTYICIYITILDVSAPWRLPYSLKPLATQNPNTETIIKMAAILGEPHQKLQQYLPGLSNKKECICYNGVNCQNYSTIVYNFVNLPSVQILNRSELVP